MEKTLVWIDDKRNPFELQWVKTYSPIGDDCKVIWVESYKEFVDYINKNSLPDAICFDHDLGLGESGYDCAKWLVEYCMDRDIPTPYYGVQSSNPVGKTNIYGLLRNYNKQYER